MSLVPDFIYAGDTVGFTASLSQYPPSDGWGLKYAFRGGNAVDVTGSADSTNTVFHVHIPSSKTALMPEGLYSYMAWVYKGAERYTVDSGKVSVRPNFETDTSERVSHAEKVLAAVESVIEGRITDDLQSFTIGGRSVTHIPIEELLQIRVIYKRELYRLRNTGVPTSRDVAVYFDGV